MRLRFSEAGFSLVEATVGMGLTLLAGFVIAQSFSLSSSIMRNSNASLDMDSLGRELSTAFNTGTQCNAVFAAGSGSASGAHVINIANADSAATAATYRDNVTNRLPFRGSNGQAILPAPGTPFGSANLTPRRITLENPRKTGAGNYIFDMIIAAGFMSGGNDNREVYTSIPINFSADLSSGNVTGCVTELGKNDFSNPVERWGPSSPGASAQFVEVVPAGMRRVKIETWGGGGGGGGGGNSYNLPGYGVDAPGSVTWASGGGGGAYSMAIINVSAGQKLYLTVGSGGAGVNFSTGRANPGSPSCVDTSAANPTCDLSSATIVISSPGGQGGIRGGMLAVGSIGYGGGRRWFSAPFGSADLSTFVVGPLVYIQSPGNNGTMVNVGLRCTAAGVCNAGTLFYAGPGSSTGGNAASGGAGGVSQMMNSGGTPNPLDGQRPGGGGGPTLNKGQFGGNGGTGKITLWW